MSYIKSIIGKINVQIYDKENNLKKTVSGKNTITYNGIKRICDILTQGRRNGISITESIDGLPLNTLPNGQNSIGLNMVEWKDKKYTTLEFSENKSGINQVSSLFSTNHDNSNYAFMKKSNDVKDNLNFFYFPNTINNDDIENLSEEEIRNKSGLVFDLGLKHIYRQEHYCNELNFYIDCCNVKYNSLIIEDFYGNKLNEGIDYKVLSWGNYENKPEIVITNTNAYKNQTLYLSYSYFNVPQVPIVGFSFDCMCTEEGIKNAQNFISGWSWSLDQGKTRLPNFFPNLSGCPSGNSNTSIDNKINNVHQSVWFNPYGQKETRFYFHTYPYAVINPTQLAWYFHLQNEEKCYFKNFSFLTMDLPKLGPQAIKLGNSNKPPTADDEKLNSLIVGSETLINCKFNNSSNEIKFEIVLDYDECVCEDVKEIGLFYPENDEAFYSDADYWNNSIENNGCGKNNNNISSTNKIVKFNGINLKDCNKMFSHGLFSESWSKTKDERVTIIYTVKINW